MLFFSSLKKLHRIFIRENIGRIYLHFFLYICKNEKQNTHISTVKKICIMYLNNEYVLD